MRKVYMFLAAILLSSVAVASSQASHSGKSSDSAPQVCYLKDGTVALVPAAVCYSLQGHQIKPGK